LLLVAFLLVNAPNCHLSLVLPSAVQRDAVNCNINKIYLKEFYCSYSRTHNIQNGFVHLLLLFFRSTLLLNRNKHIGGQFCVFL